jgi:SAM-dependent methyltransferase
MKTETKTHHALEAVESGAARDIEDALWWVQGRKSIIRRHIQKIVSRPARAETIMDVGCGSGGNLDVLAEFGRVIGVEPSRVLAERARGRGVASEVYELPAWELDETRSVDLLTMFDVLEHIECDTEFLERLRYSAAPNHMLLLSVPACQFLFGDHDRLLSHYRRYSLTTLKQCLARAGYRPLSIRYYMFFPFPAALAARVIDKVKSQFGIKRQSVDIGLVPPLVNWSLKHVLRLEAAVSQYVRFPIGLWLFAIAEPHGP